jgi:hypothetical protein
MGDDHEIDKRFEVGEPFFRVSLGKPGGTVTITSIDRAAPTLAITDGPIEVCARAMAVMWTHMSETPERQAQQVAALREHQASCEHCKRAAGDE